MPTGPKGQKRPADVISNAVKIMRIATGEEEDTVVDDGKEGKGGKYDARATGRDCEEGGAESLEISA
jgi:hypothetical protein